MRADGHAPGRPAPGGQDADQRTTEELLRDGAREIADVAEGVRAVAERTADALLAPPRKRSARHPRTGLTARWALLRALTDPRGLGTPAGAARRRLTRLLGARRGGEPLAALMAVTALRLRIAAVLTGHPELARDPGMRRLTAALGTQGDREAVRALRTLFQDPGAQRALAALAPVLAELLTVRALLDAEPPDGPEPAPEPGHDQGAAEAVDLRDREKQTLATEGSLLGFLRNIDILAPEGRVLVQNVRGPDGVVRYVVQAPGTDSGRPRHGSPHDVVGAWREQLTADSPYTRALRPAIEDHGIPRGAELALIGHGEGGTALLNLARDAAFCRAYRLTHVIAVGSPAPAGRPADPRTWVGHITNEHDLVPAATTPAPHPERYEARYTGPTRAFPRSHLLREYMDHLRTVAPAARAHIDDALTPYRGPVVRSQAYQLKDPARPPEGHPFLTLPTASVPTTTGPVGVPVRYQDSAAAHLCFPVDTEAVRALLPDVPWMRPSGIGRRTLAVLSLYEHRCSTLGPYTEIALSVPVDDLWRPRPADLATDLLRRADLRRTGRYVLSSAVTSEEARVATREIWGQPAVRAAAEAHLTGPRLRLSAPGLGIAVLGRLGPGVRCPEPDWALYGRRGDSTVRTTVRTSGRPRLHAGAGVRLRLDTAAAEPMAGHLRRLGIDTARPLFVVACPQFMVHRAAGAVLPR
ncbi:acetoacetate decarboxylase family protein [Streptomyces sp. BV129]|uniref:acetoacetate decarboxylase family protein n=1 Tax=Streptomyces sp. BV129 TaxID=2849671 RepID=UPI001C2E8A4D|nr:acetoacetate decarboxylase family protein [Streptomyces sp. BV129]MBV1946853.1 acetoacetate decarboxylase family protein [Streptomyces sp. BV129]